MKLRLWLCRKLLPPGYVVRPRSALVAKPGGLYTFTSSGNSTWAYWTECS